MSMTDRSQPGRNAWICAAISRIHQPIMVQWSPDATIRIWTPFVRNPPTMISPKCDEQKLREAGQRLTSPRRTVLQIMQESHGHIGAEKVAELAMRADPSINVATVYRILSWLTEQEIICVTDMGTREHLYEYLGHPRHHHLVCNHCGTHREIPFDLMDPITAALRERYGFEARIDHQAFFGTCSQCLMST